MDAAIDAAVVDGAFESLACALDHLNLAPLPWAVSSALQNAPTVLQGAASVSERAVRLVRWAGRALLDGYFVPVAECSAYASDTSADHAWNCARGVVYMGLVHVDRFGFGPAVVVNEALAAASSAAWHGTSGCERLPLHAAKAAVMLATPNPMVGYFIGNQIELAHAVGGGASSRAAPLLLLCLALACLVAHRLGLRWRRPATSAACAPPHSLGCHARGGAAVGAARRARGESRGVRRCRSRGRSSSPAPGSSRHDHEQTSSRTRAASPDATRRRRAAPAKLAN